MTEVPGSISTFFSQLRAGDQTAVEPLWQRYFPRLLALARRTLMGRPQRMTDAEDAVQSAFVSFWRRSIDGGLGDALDRDDLWNLLGTITIRKALGQARRERAEKRGGGRVVTEGALGDSEGQPMTLDDFAAPVPPADFDLQCTELLNHLDHESRVIAVLRLFGHRNREIAEQLDCTERKIERKLNLIRMVWEAE